MTKVWISNHMILEQSSRNRNDAHKSCEAVLEHQDANQCLQTFAERPKLLGRPHLPLARSAQPRAVSRTSCQLDQGSKTRERRGSRRVWAAPKTLVLCTLCNYHYRCRVDKTGFWSSKVEVWHELCNYFLRLWILSFEENGLNIQKDLVTKHPKPIPFHQNFPAPKKPCCQRAAEEQPTAL